MPEPQRGDSDHVRRARDVPHLGEDDLLYDQQIAGCLAAVAPMLVEEKAEIVCENSFPNDARSIPLPLAFGHNDSKNEHVPRIHLHH